MDRKELIESIAYCGLICTLCHLADKCDGCKSEENKCSEAESPNGCYHRNCCISKGIDGCFACNDFPCNNHMFIGRTRGEIVGFCRCIKEDGAEKFIEYIMENQGKGIKYGIEGYGSRDEKDVLWVLRESKVKQVRCKTD